MKIWFRKEQSSKASIPTDNFFNKKPDNIHQRDKIATYFISIDRERVWVYEGNVEFFLL